MAEWQLAREIHRRVFRIGVNQSPPFNTINQDGSFGGLGVEMLKEAAKRSGISLEWVAIYGGVDEALAAGLVDLWPILTDIPERRKRLYLTDPWLENQFVMLVRQADGFAPLSSFKGKRIATLRLMINERLLRKFVPGVQVVSLATKDEGIQAVCRARSSQCH